MKPSTREWVSKAEEDYLAACALNRRRKIPLSNAVCFHVQQAVEKYLKDEEYFLANYADGLTDLPLNEMIESFKKSRKIACFVCVKPSQSFHVVTLRDGGLVEKIQYVRDTDILINGGFFVFKKEIFDYIGDGEELVIEPFERLISEGQLVGYKYDNYWCMDTFKEHQELNDMCHNGDAPWEVWRKNK